MARVKGSNCRQTAPRARGLQLLDVSMGALEEFCRRNRIRWLSRFGSTLSGEPKPESDIALLVEFAPGHVPGFFKLVRMEDELSAMLGRKANLRTPEDLSRHFRDEVMASAEVLYAEV